MAGEEGLFRIGFERAEGIPGHDFTSIKFTSETFDMDRPDEVDPDLDPSGNETSGENLKAEGKGKLTAAGHTESMLKMRIQQHGFYDKTIPVAGVHLWELRDFDETSDTPIAFNVDSLHGGIWRDQLVDPTEYSFFGARTNEFTCSVDANKYVRFEHDMLYLRDRDMAAPIEQAVNAAFLGDMHVRGYRNSSLDDAEYLKFKFTDAGAFDGSAKFVTGKGAAAYGTTEYPLVANTWTDFMIDDLPAGSRLEPLQILVRTDALSVATVDDEFRIYPTETKPVPVYSSRPKLNGAALEMRFSLDGGTTWFTKTVDQYSLKFGTPISADFSLGSIYAQNITKADNAKRWWEVTLNRPDFSDRDFLKAMKSRTRIEVFIRFYGGYIGATGLEEYAEFSLPVMRITQAGATVTRAGKLPESVTLRAEPESAGAPLCYERYRNTIASVTPT